MIGTLSKFEGLYRPHLVTPVKSCSFHISLSVFSQQSVGRVAYAWAPRKVLDVTARAILCHLSFCSNVENAGARGQHAISEASCCDQIALGIPSQRTPVNISSSRRIFFVTFTENARWFAHRRLVHDHKWVPCEVEQTNSITTRDSEQSTCWIPSKLLNFYGPTVLGCVRAFVEYVWGPS